MGMDVLGVEPLSEEGEYFRANIFSWGPIVSVLYKTCEDVLTEEDFKGIQFNMGHEICKGKATTISNRLAVFLEHNTEGVDLGSVDDEIDGSSSDITMNITKVVSQMFDEVSKLGEGVKVELGNQGKYTVQDQHLAEFATFCRQSGGFQVW
tara:strand:- start:48 stop:500 length:453 start_codon:yes stop_codon:yes gene_type:complete